MMMQPGTYCSYETLSKTKVEYGTSDVDVFYYEYDKAGIF
jgi:hypothetical protein